MINYVLGTERVKEIIHDSSTPRKWRGGTPSHSISQRIYLRRSFTDRSTQFLGDRLECGGVRFSQSHWSYFRFIARQSKWSGQISRLVENPNFRARHSNFHRFFALMTNFEMERSIFRGVKHS
ncbi:hypothetical protein AVEN_267164-1 [Araneus ventricosus]|uniref:Uncharacterized protein n=1 Tax=Araneus ventricosus TaxID=182803 RepID=A0A4Y2LKI5_ARAVE|nr:hypothetical protein AVEN_267164-1 [Araneus ventricosus]